VKLQTKFPAAALAAGIAICAVAFSATASDLGMAAADQVSEISYIDFLDNWLYTHTGDGRGPSSPEHDLARDNIYALFSAYGLQVALEPFSWSGTHYNVVATQVGTTFPDQEFIIGAHYDSVSNPGADDNASGVALVLEAARILSQYDSAYTIRYIAFDMEEVGLVGADAYVSAHAGDDILMMLSCDMVAYDTGTNEARIYSRGNPVMGTLGAAIDEYGNGLTWLDAGWISASDHASFDQAGYEAGLLIESEVWNNPHYHTPLDCFDTPGYLDFAYAARMTRSVVGWLVDQAEVLVEYDGLAFEYPDGRPEFISPAGGTTMRVDVVGVGVVSPQPGTGMLHYDTGFGWQSVPMVEVSSNVYDAVFPAAMCGSEVSYSISAVGDDGETYSNPTHAPNVAYSTLGAYGESVSYENTLDADPGWSTQDLWAFGQPTGGGGQYGGPDPTSGYTGPYVYGYSLNGDYQNQLPERHLTSDPIDCTGRFGLTLRFQRWLGVEQPSYDHAYVRVSNNGNTWVTVWENTAEITDDQWESVEYNISAVADDQPDVYLRWTIGETDSSWQYCGWNIDDVQLVALDCEGPCPPDVNGDGSVDVDDLTALILAWGSCPQCPADIDGNGVVDVDDLTAVILGWGACP
jgi:hypothetical protein